MLNTYKVPYTHFNTDDYPPEERVNAAVEYLAPSFVPVSLQDCENENRMRIRRWFLDTVMLMEIAATAFALRRGDALDHDVVGLRYVEKGEVRGFVGDHAFHAKAGEAFIADVGKLGYLETSDCVIQTAGFAHSSVGYDRSVHPEFVLFTRDTQTVNFIREILGFVHSGLPDWSPREAHVAAETIRGMMRGLLNPNVAHGQQYAADWLPRIVAIKQFVETNLTTSALDADTVCREFGVSRATLFRMFRAKGGIVRYVHDRRLERAFIDLAQSSGASTVGQIASRYKFYDIAHFSKAFRKKFGFPAREILGAAAKKRFPAGSRSCQRPEITRFLTLFKHFQ